MERDRGQSRGGAGGRERSGKQEVDRAVQQHLAAGTPAEAAALLAQYARYEDAGHTLLQHLGVPADQVGDLDEPRRKLARLAASYLAKTAAAPLAVQLFVSLGDPVRAAEVLERMGDLLGAQKLRQHGARRGGRAPQTVNAVGGEAVNRDKALQLERGGQRELAAQVYVALKQYADAGRLMRELGKPAAAAQLYVEGNLPYEAAFCYLEAGDTGKGMENLVRVPRGDARYRQAARLAVQVATQLKLLNFQLEYFLSDFVRQGPEDEKERAAFLQLAELYLLHDAPDSAKEALRRLLDRFPGDAETVARLQQVEQSTRRPSALLRHIGEQDSAFLSGRGRGADDEILPGLPALPDLPGGPMVGTAGTRLGVGAQALATASQRAAAAPAPAAAAPAAAHGSAPSQAGHGDAATRDLGAVAGAPLALGAIVAGRYRLDSRLGQGGMAVVFKAFDLELEESLALKVFLGEQFDAAMQAQSLARFKQELKLNRQLAHPNIVRLYDIGLYQGHRYLSMELLVGSGLDELLGGPLPLERAIGLLLQLCRGLQAAHEAGVIHRDIKPQNLFVTQDDVLKVMDFGIAKAADTNNLTRTGMIAGTPRYMAPEQITGFSTVTAAADLYSVGVVAYQMIAGVLPFDHEEMMPLIMKKLNEQAASLVTHRPEVPPELDSVVLRLLDKDARQRFASCSELALALQQVRLPRGA
ncbi:MAG: serine/threonine protein kinase [Proteobacteria bacterium]|nr:serine/threonine protein kinase [Pseudomonadota bacterium]